MSGLDGKGFVDTSFLGPEWHIEKMVPASDIYSDCETALWDLCPGCADERGWLAMVNERGSMCEWMQEASDYKGKPMVDLWIGPDGQHFEQCHYRRSPWLAYEESRKCDGQTELELA